MKNNPKTISMLSEIEQITSSWTDVECDAFRAFLEGLLANEQSGLRSKSTHRGFV